jgi:hypothetical protein
MRACAALPESSNEKHVICVRRPAPEVRANQRCRFSAQHVSLLSDLTISSFNVICSSVRSCVGCVAEDVGAVRIARLPHFSLSLNKRSDALTSDVAFKVHGIQPFDRPPHTAARPLNAC